MVPSGAPGDHSSVSAAALRITGIVSPAVVGNEHTVTVEALGVSGELFTEYANTIVFSSTDANADLPDPYTFAAADGGVHIFVITWAVAGTHSLTVTANDSTLIAEVQVEVRPPAVRVSIVRSVGANSEVLADGISGNNGMVLQAGVLQLHSVLPSHVGVGDVLVYDSDDDGVRDAVAILTVRLGGGDWGVTDTRAGLPPDVVDERDWQVVRAYTSLSDAMVGLENPAIDAALADFDPGQRDLYSHNEEWHLYLYADAVDASALVYAWPGDGSTGNCLHIEAGTTQAPLPQSHAGAWDDTAVRLTGNSGMDIIDGCVRLRGLQIDVTGDAPAIQIGADANIDVEVSGCILRGSSSAAGGIDIQIDATSAAVTVVNNTVVASNTGISITGTSGGTLANNLVQGSGTDYLLDAMPGWTLAANISDDDTSPTSAFALRSVAFRDGAAGDYRLKWDDTVAVDAGVTVEDEALDGDIEGQHRSGSWDIGADERAARIWRSVGPGNQAALAQGGAANTLTVTSGVAQFSGTLPDRIGVGDVLLYDLDGGGALAALAVIHGRISASEYRVADAGGGRPQGTLAASQAWRIFRAYTSLLDAEAGDENAGIDQELRNFDTWWDGRELVANNEQWNIALYGDGPDTTPVDINRWTTSRSNTLRIYTPVDVSEVGVSQRHTGVWTDTAYRMVTTSTEWGGGIYIGGPGIHFDGLQIEVGADRDTGATYAFGFLVPPSLTVTNSILRATGPGTASDDDAGIAISRWGHNTLVYLRNNIIDGFGIGIASLEISGWVHGAIDNNTIVNCGSGVVFREFSATNHDVLMRNNLVKGASPNYDIEFNPVTAANLSSDGTSPDAGFRDAVIEFAAAGDYHLAVGDTAAIGQGVDLSTDIRASFADDVDGEVRIGPWDIGADEL